MNRFEFIVKCFCLIMLVLPNSAFAVCCCASGACGTQVRVEDDHADSLASATSRPPCACCAIEVEQPSCCHDSAGDFRDCNCCECSVPSEVVGILASQVRPVAVAVQLPSIETMPVHSGAAFDSNLYDADFIPISHQQRQALLSVWRN